VDTRIATPNGEKKIQDIQVGDVVMGVDHVTGEVVETPVLATREQPTHKELFEFFGTWGTGEHPIWTQEAGYVKLSTFDLMDCTIQTLEGLYAKNDVYVRAVREGLSCVCQKQNRNTPVLWQSVCVCSSCSTADSLRVLRSVVCPSGRCGSEDRERQILFQTVCQPRVSSTTRCAGESVCIYESADKYRYGDETQYPGVCQLGQKSLQGAAGRSDQTERTDGTRCTGVRVFVGGNGSPDNARHSASYTSGQE
jgi:hypothetical protein